MTLFETLLVFACITLFAWNAVLTYMVVDMQDSVVSILNNEESSHDD